MRHAAWMILLIGGCAGGGGATSRFRAEFGTPSITADFSCEVQTLHTGRTVRIKEQPKEAAKAGKSLVLEPGGETIAWLYHFQDDGSTLKDEERAFTIAVSIRGPRTERIALPSDRASVVFFCDNWGDGFRAAEARATSGWLEIEEVADRKMGGRMEIVLEGTRERADGSREPLTVRLGGHFRATP